MRIRKCVKCSRYTLKMLCPLCGSETTNPQPPKYSPTDKYGEFRRKMLAQSD
ncbi:MAG: RNA-protein complex protein Nop10 [Candidatus Aenigmarchaeota archaeon]|nr:RNA-protein complex protein Nop10 [Candidatus Aenigmarchaeota archaeon]MDW8160351.1 RNA-protein complex protein Nop10 [Candidatus Aenigmarchaeota archaeon]